MALTDETLPLASGGSQQATLAVGDVLDGKYELVRLLGEGGMGAVWEAKNRTVGRVVAIKCLLPHAAASAMIVARFEQEARAATAIGNEHIVEVFDMGRLASGAPYMVMERLQGCDLEQLISRDGPLTLAHASALIGQICDGLAAAHARGIVHRDMKPLNVFVTSRSDRAEFIKLLDFGISKVRGEIGSATDGMTRTGVAMGTPYYMPPEQAQGRRDLDHRADIYAVGAILYEMITGDMPLDADSTAELLARILRDRPVPPTAIRPELPAAIDDVVMRALEKDPRDRYQNVQDLAAALQAVATTSAEAAEAATLVSATLADPQTLPAPTGDKDSFADWNEPSASRRWKVPVLLASIAAAVVLTWALLRGGGDESAASSPPVATDPAATPPVVAPAASVRVHLTVEPKHAFLYINGERFPNPLDARQPRSLKPARITIEAPGYAPTRDVVIFDRDVTRAYKLTHLSTEVSRPDAGTVQRRPSTSRSTGTRRSGSVRSRAKTRDKPGSAKNRTAASPPAPVPDPVEPTVPSKGGDNKTKPDGIYRGKRGSIREDW